MAKMDTLRSRVNMRKVLFFWLGTIVVTLTVGIVLLVIYGYFFAFPQPERELSKENTYTVRDFVITESIYDTSIFIDPAAEHVIVVTHGGEILAQARELYSYEVPTPPRIEAIDDLFIIQTYDDLVLIAPDNDVINFDFRQVKGYETYEAMLEKERWLGRVGYRPEEFWIDEDRWYVQGRCWGNCARGSPEWIAISDEGDSFQLAETSLVQQ